MNTETWLGLGLAFITALVLVIAIHTPIVKFAKRHRIVDCPNERKLQREPIPVLGGVSAFFGLVVGVIVASFFIDIEQLMPVFVAMVMMLCVGVVDDVVGLSAKIRFLIEIVGTVALIIFTGHSLNDFHGLWGIDELPVWVSMPLTIISVVGIINAINLIDGVDGLSSGFCILACTIFGALFYKVGNDFMLLLCLLSIASLLPFFFHNVFGHKTKMFIGDGGSLMMGVVMSICVVRVISSGGYCDSCEEWGVGLVPFSFSVLCVPVFDTLRVMIMRILRRTSPFHPDKTHLHHLFIELGFSHLGTTLSILSINLLVVAAWWGSYRLGASIDVQFYIVIACCLLMTAGFYKFMRVQISRNTAIYRFMRRMGEISHFESSRAWQIMHKLVDRL